MSTSGGYLEYIGGCSVHQRDIMSAFGDIMSTLEDLQYCGGIMIHMGDIVHDEYIRGC